MNTRIGLFERRPLVPAFTHSKRRRRWLLGLGVWLCLVPGWIWAQPAPPEVLDAASNGLPAFLSCVPAEGKERYGFPKGSDPDQALLGAPYRVYTITATALDRHSTNDTLTTLLSETSLWYFPVLMGEEMKAILVVDRMPGGWEAVSLGYAPLARELNQIGKQWPSAAGYHPRLVAVFPANRCYFTVPEAGERNLTPIVMPGQAAEPATPSGAPSRYSTLAPLPQAVGPLKAAFDRLTPRPVN